MTRFLCTMSLMSLILTCGCKSAPEPMPQGPYVEATPEPPPTPNVQVVGVPYPQPVPGQAKPWPPSEPSAEAIEDAKKEALSPDKVMDAANEEARQSPSPEGFINATLVYDFMPGALYQVWSAPNHLTMIDFAPGEEIYDFAAGDTIRWQVGQTYSGKGSKLRSHLVIEPVRRDLHTSMIVTTSLGTYSFELRSYQHSYLASVTFRYPRQTLEIMHAQALVQSKEEHAVREATQDELAVDLTQVEDRYRFIVEDKDDAPSWMPRRVFHDGKRTYIDFGKELGEEKLPALFLYSKSKKPRVVQYKVRGRYMIVAGVIEFGMLRMGEEEDESVGIELKKEARS